jgi:hypothetical protein
VCIAATGAVVALVQTALADASPRQQLRDAATGTWSGDFGTLQFLPDGTATFTVKVCGFSPVRPGFVRTFTDCAPDVATGKLSVQTGGYVVKQSDGGEYNFGAYVDGSRLFLGHGIVARLDRDRRGTVHLGGSEELRVGDGRCTYTSVFVKKPIDRPCSFVTRSGRTVLLYEAPDPFKAGSGRVARAGLVYLPGPRLLVSPELVERPFTRPTP